MSKHVVIAISGKAGSGKTTVAGYIQQWAKDEYCEGRLYSIAWKLKEIATEVFKWNGEKGQGDKKDSGRNLLINIGNAFRDIRPNVWIDFLIQRIRQEQPMTNRDFSHVFYIIDDLRFQNEADKLREAFGDAVVFIRLERPGIQEIQDVTENDLDAAKKVFDYKFYNTGGLVDLKKWVDEAMSDIVKKLQQGR